jgi:CheY-like chemotaxis protein
MKALPPNDNSKVVPHDLSFPKGEVSELSYEQIQNGLKSLLNFLKQPPLPFVILIEDEEKDALLFRAALQRAHVAVEFMHFKHAKQARDFFQGKGAFSDRKMYPLPNLTVLDFRLIKDNGIKILEQIRNTPYLKELVVVGLTGSDDQFEEARRLKINDCILKPSTLPGLVEIVHQLNLTWLSGN